LSRDARSGKCFNRARTRLRMDSVQTVGIMPFPDLTFSPLVLLAGETPPLWACGGRARTPSAQALCYEGGQSGGALCAHWPRRALAREGEPRGGDGKEGARRGLPERGITRLGARDRTAHRRSHLAPEVDPQQVCCKRRRAAPEAGGQALHYKAQDAGPQAASTALERRGVMRRVMCERGRGAWECLRSRVAAASGVCFCWRQTCRRSTPCPSKPKSANVRDGAFDPRQLSASKMAPKST
jgi:hypothetical protein